METPIYGQQRERQERGRGAIRQRTSNDLRNFISDNTRSSSAGPTSTLSRRSAVAYAAAGGNLSIIPVTANQRVGPHWLNLHDISEKIFRESVFISPSVLNSITEEINKLWAMPKTPKTGPWRPLSIILVASKNYKVVLSLENKLKTMYGQQAVQHVFDQKNDVWLSMDLKEDVEIQLPVDVVIANGFIAPKGRNVRSVYCLGLPLGGREQVFLDQFVHFLEKCGCNSGQKKRSILSRLWFTRQMPNQCAQVKKWYVERDKSMIKPSVEPDFSFVIDEDVRRERDLTRSNSKEKVKEETGEVSLQSSPAKRPKIDLEVEAKIELGVESVECSSSGEVKDQLMNEEVEIENITTEQKVESVEEEEGGQDLQEAAGEVKEEAEEDESDQDLQEAAGKVKEEAEEEEEEDVVQLHAEALEYFTEGDEESKEEVKVKVKAKEDHDKKEKSPVKELKREAIESEETESDSAVPLPEFFTSITSMDKFEDMDIVTAKVSGDMTMSFQAMRETIVPGQAAVDPILLDSFVKEVLDYVKTQRKKAMRAERKMIIVLAGTRNRAALYAMGKKLEEDIGEDKVYGAVDLPDNGLPWQDLTVRAPIEVPNSVEVFLCNALFPVSSARSVGRVMALGLPRMPPEPNGTLLRYTELLCQLPVYVDALASAYSTDEEKGQRGEIPTTIWICRRVLREVEAVTRFCADNKECSYTGLESVDVARLLKVGADQYEKEKEEATKRRSQSRPPPSDGGGGRSSYRGRVHQMSSSPRGRGRGYELRSNYNPRPGGGGRGRPMRMRPYNRVPSRGRY